MKNLLLASVALSCVAFTPGFATNPGEYTGAATVSPNHLYLQMLADSDDGDNSGGDDSADHDSNDDHGRASDTDDDNDDDSNNGDSSSGRKKPRVPGGSGCDSARDRAEHPECNAG
jgi:hypothetical protein